MGVLQSKPPSFEDVRRDLQRELLLNARSQLYQYGIGADEQSTLELEQVLSRIAMEQFKENYGYEYHSSSRQCQPPRSKGGNRTVDKMCSIVPPIDTQVNTYVKTMIFTALDLPSWMKQEAMDDLCAWVNGLVKDDTSRQWRRSTHSRVFDPKIDDMDYFACDFMLVYANGSLIKDNLQTQICIIYYMGVYYKTHSPLVEVLNRLQSSAYDASSNFSPHGHGPNDEQQLKVILENHAIKCFKEYFSFSFDQIPYDSSTAAGVGHGYITKNTRLCCWRNLEDDQNIGNFIKQQIFSGLNLPLDSVKDAATENMLIEFKNVINSAPSNDWHVRRLGHTYKPVDSSYRPVQERGVIIFWHCSENAPSGGRPVSVTFIFIMTELYQTLPPEQRAVRSMLRLLCNNVRLRLQLPGHLNPNASDNLKYLRDILHDYTKFEFRREFGFNYAGRSSQPPDSIPGTHSLAFNKLFFAQDHPTSRGIEEWIDAELFRKHDLVFGLDRRIGDNIWFDIRDAMLHLTDSCSRPDWWFHTLVTKEYQNTTHTPIQSNIKHYGIFVYAYGEMETEDDEIVHRAFLYYLGIFCSTRRQ